MIIPVKYDYQDLWRWSEVINRFVTSSANTIGITRARMGENSTQYPEVIYPLPELQEVGRFPRGGRRVDELRTTIHVITLELQRTVAALPALLSALGIPVDAVGVVARPNETPRGLRIQAARLRDVQPSGALPQPVSQPSPAGGQAGAGKVVADAGPRAEGAMATSGDASGSSDAKSNPDGAMTASGSASDGAEGASDQVEPAQAVEPVPDEGGASRWLLVGVAGALAVAAVAWRPSWTFAAPGGEPDELARDCFRLTRSNVNEHENKDNHLAARKPFAVGDHGVCGNACVSCTGPYRGCGWGAAYSGSPIPSTNTYPRREKSSNTGGSR